MGWPWGARVKIWAPVASRGTYVPGTGVFIAQGRGVMQNNIVGFLGVQGGLVEEKVYLD